MKQFIIRESLKKSFRRIPESRNHLILLDSGLRRSDEKALNQGILNTVIDNRPGKCIRTYFIEIDEHHADEHESARWVKNKKLNKVTQQKADRLAIERGEDDGMRVFQNTFTGAYNSQESQ